MPSGGPRKNPGPPPSPNSARSDARGLSRITLPAEGYSGDVPDFPLNGATDRERELWAWAWGQPIGAYWATPQASHLVMAIAFWCRVSAQFEADPTPTRYTAVRQAAHEALLSEDAMAKHDPRLTVVADELTARREEPKAAKATGSRARMGVAGGSG